MQNKLFFSWLLSIVVLVVLMACSTQNDINPSLNMPSKEEDISSKSENENLIVERLIFQDPDQRHHLMFLRRIQQHVYRPLSIQPYLLD